MQQNGRLRVHLWIPADGNIPMRPLCLQERRQPVTVADEDLSRLPFCGECALIAEVFQFTANWLRGFHGHTDPSVLEDKLDTLAKRPWAEFVTNFEWREASDDAEHIAELGRQASTASVSPTRRARPRRNNDPDSRGADDRQSTDVLETPEG